MSGMFFDSSMISQNWASTSSNFKTQLIHLSTVNNFYTNGDTFEKNKHTPNDAYPTINH